MPDTMRTFFTDSLPNIKNVYFLNPYNGYGFLCTTLQLLNLNVQTHIYTNLYQGILFQSQFETRDPYPLQVIEIKI